MRAGVSKSNIAAVLVDRVVDTAMEIACDRVYPVRKRLRRGITTVNHQRNTGLINQDGIRLINDRCCKTAVYLLLLIQGKLVAQIIKTDLVGSGIGYITGVSPPPRCRIHVPLDVCN